MRSDKETWLGKTSAAVAFLRVSSARQKDNTSHETQETEIRRYCDELGLELRRVVKIVESAANSERRQAYTAAQDEALAAGCRHFMFYMSDRETRNLTDNERNEQLVRSGLVVLHYVRDRQVVHEHSSESDFFMRDMFAVQNKQYIRVLRTKVMDAQKTKAQHGWFPLNRLPLGYAHERRKDDSGRELRRGTIIVPDPDRRRVEQAVREFELRAAGASLREVRRQVIAEGFIPADKVAGYYLSGIEQRLKSRFYAGYFTYRGIEYEGRHELIIPPTLYAAVQRTFTDPKPRRQSGGVFGGGWLTCADPRCGCVVTYDPKTKTLKGTGKPHRFEYYRCSNGRRVHDRAVYVSEQTIWDQLGAAFDDFTLSEARAKEIAAMMDAMTGQAKALNRAQARAHQDALSALEAEEDRVYGDLRAGVLDDDAYKRHLARIREQRADYNRKLADLQGATTEAFGRTASWIIELAMSARSLWEGRNPSERKAMLETVLSNQTLEGKTIRYDLQKPFAALAKIQKIGDGGSEGTAIEPAHLEEFWQAVAEWAA